MANHFKLPWIIVALILGGLASQAHADAIQDRDRHCAERVRVTWDKAVEPADHLARGFLAALCSVRRGAAYHGTIVWSAAATANAGLWQAAAKQDRILRVLESFANDASADIPMRIAAIGAIGEFARNAGNGERTLRSLLEIRPSDPAIAAAALKAYRTFAPGQLAGFVSGRLEILPEEDLPEFLVAVANSNSTLPEEDLRKAAATLGRLKVRSMRPPNPRTARTPQNRGILRAQDALAKVVARQPPEVRASLAPTLINVDSRRQTLKALTLSPAATRQLAVQTLKSVRNRFALHELLLVFLPVDDENGQIASALAETVKRLDFSNGPIVERTIGLLSEWPDEALKGLVKEIKTQQAASSKEDEVDGEAKKKAALELLEKLKRQTGAERRETLRILLPEITEADDLDGDNLAEALRATPDSLADDLEVLRTAAEANDDTSSSMAVKAIHSVSTPSTRAADAAALRRLAQQNKGNAVEGEALDVLEEWADADRPSHVRLLRELIAAGRNTETEVKAIELLYESGNSGTDDLEPLRLILAAHRGGETDKKAIEIVGERGDAKDRALIVGLIDPDYPHAVAAIETTQKYSLPGAGARLRKILSSRRNQDQLSAAIDAVSALRIREAVDEIVQIVVSPESEEERAETASASRSDKPAEKNNKLDAAVKKSLETVVVLNKVQPLSDVELDRVGKALVTRLERESNNDITSQLQKTLGAIRYTKALGDILSALIRPDRAAEAALAKMRVEALGTSVLSLIGEPIPTVVPILRAASQNRFEEVRLRGAAHLAGGDDPGAETLIAALGPDAPFQAYLNLLVDKTRVIEGLVAFANAFQLKDATPEEKKEITERARELAIKWCGTTSAPDTGFLKEPLTWLGRFLETATAPLQKDCIAPDLAIPISKLATLTGDETFKRLIAPSMWAKIVKDYWPYLLLHPVAWLALIFLYPRSPAVQSIFFWNRWGRVFLGLFYVHFLITYVPPLRRRLLRPLERDLLDGAGVRIDDPEPFFENVNVTDGERDLGTAINVLLGQSTESISSRFASGPLLIEGASGLGKSALLREYTRRLRSAGQVTVVFLAAEDCGEGIEQAILQRLKINAPSEDRYVRTLVYTGGLILVIDGVNEVVPETRVKIASFVAGNRRGRIVLATQPSVWRSDAIPRLELRPLRPDQIEAFLNVYAAAPAAQSEYTVEQYREGVSAFAASALTVADEDHRSLLSRPVMLTIVSRLIWLGEAPQISRLVEQIIDLAERRYDFFIQGGEFPRLAFAESVLAQALQSRKSGFPRGDLTTCWLTLERQRLARPVGAKNTEGVAEEYAFIHELFLSFYLSVALFPPNLAQTMQRQTRGDSVPPDQLRWQPTLDKIEQFRSAYFYYADTGPEADVRAVADFWKKRWLETNDRFYREFEIRIERRFRPPLLPAAA